MPQICPVFHHRHHQERQPVRIPEANAHENNNVAMSIRSILDAEADAGNDKESDTSENLGYIDEESGVEDDISSFEEEVSDQELSRN